MSPLLNYLDYLSRITNEAQFVVWKKDALSTITAGRLHSLWTQPPLGAATPTVAAVCTSSTVGAIPLPIAGQALGIAQVVSSMADASGVCSGLIADRLYQTAGLSGIVTSPQAVTPLPLPRYASGIGVCMDLEIYTTVGATITTATVEYLDDADVVRVSPSFVFGGASNRNARQMIPVPLHPLSRGVKEVRSVTVVGTTDLAGNFGVTLYRPLAILPEVGNTPILHDAVIGSAGNFPVCLADACLFGVLCPRALLTNALGLEFRMIPL